MPSGVAKSVVVSRRGSSLDKTREVAQCREDWYAVHAPYQVACTNLRLCNKSGEPDLLGCLRCKKVLRYQLDWRYICAMLIGYARVSTDAIAKSCEIQRRQLAFP
jgi:hypothetical protein